MRANGVKARLHLEPVVDEARSAERRRVEHAGQQRTEDAAHGMHAEHVQRVIGLQPALELVDAPQAYQAGGGADHERAGNADVARGRGNRHQAGDRAGSGAQHRGLALEQPFAERPRQHRTGGRQEGVHEGQHGAVAGLERGAGVEPEPAHPQQRGADHGQRQVVRRHVLLAAADALADQVGAHQAGDTGVDVHHRAAGEVERTPLPEQTGLGVLRIHHVGGGVRIRARPEPDHVRDRNVGEGEPQHHEHQHRRKLHPFGERTQDQGAGDGREGGLEGDEGELGDRRVLAEGGRHRELALDGVERTLQEQPVPSAEEGAQFAAAFREREAVAVDGPQHRDQRKDHEHLHQHRERVLGTHHAAVEQGQCRHAHHDHQRRGHQHPRDVALVGHRRRRGGGGHGVGETQHRQRQQEHRSQNAPQSFWIEE